MDERLIFRCPGCENEFEADLSLVGTESQCPDCGINFIVPIPEIQPGMELAGFVLKRKLGSGGMGEVWLAWQNNVERDIAVKILSPSLVSNRAFVERFMHEMKIAGKLDHPNIIPVFGAGHIQGLYYLSMAYVDGVELSDRLKIDHKIPEKECLNIARDISSALEYAWNEFRIMHRDVKPSNIMIDRKSAAKLMDMGISKSLNDMDQAMTISGTLVGTPYYISPEQAKGESTIDFHTDIYSLGASLYHMATGEFAFDGDTTVRIVTRHVTDPLVPPIEVNPELSPEMNALIVKMMNKSPADRQASWAEVLSDIALVKEGKFPSPLPGAPVPARKVEAPPAGTLMINVPKVQINMNKAAAAPAKKEAASPAKTLLHTPPQVIQPPTDSSRPKIKIKGQPEVVSPAPMEEPTPSPAPTPAPAPVRMPNKEAAPAPASQKPQLKMKSVEAPPTPENLKDPFASKKIKPARGFPVAVVLNIMAILSLLAAAGLLYNLATKILSGQRISVAQQDMIPANITFMNLKAKADHMAAEGKFTESADIMDNYHGEHEVETASRRARAAAAYRQAAKTAETADENK